MKKTGRVLAASDRVRIGIVGLGNRGSYWVQQLSKRDDVDVAYLCDVDARRFERVAETMDAAGREPGRTVQDFRRVLDDPEVDAVLIATNHHWHGLLTVLACQAGKDVYVEKPGCHDARDGRKAVEAARKYGRVVQVGVQNRSFPYIQEARERVRGGVLGKIHLARVLSMNEGRLRPREAETPPPSSLDWDLWCGPGPLTPYSPGTWHVNRFDYSAGRIIDDAAHQYDTMRFVAGFGSPSTVVHAGGVLHYRDGRDIPDTQVATLEYPDGVTVIFQATLWAQYIHETPSVIRDGDGFPDWLFNGTLVELFGSEGMMLLGRHGGGWLIYDLDGKLVDSSYGRRTPERHMTDFLECVRSREAPIANLEDVYPSSLALHLANVSYRAGERKLVYDAGTGTIAGDAEAESFMGYAGREPWVLPDEV